MKALCKTIRTQCVIRQRRFLVLKGRRRELVELYILSVYEFLFPLCIHGRYLSNKMTWKHVVCTCDFSPLVSKVDFVNIGP